MKLVYGELRNDFYGKNELQSSDLTLHCKNEDEFYKAWEKIKDINGVEWCGCPDVEDNGKYADIVAAVKKTRHMSNRDVIEEIKEIRDEIEQALEIGKYRKQKKRA